MPDPFPTQLQGITDLTVVADIKPGLIEGIFDSRSYAWRLRQVLALLDAARHASREAAQLPNPYADAVGRLRGVHFFRFGMLPGDRQLFLNVTFDGGWEPYIRLIWGPLGTMLDLILCHCEGYPLAATSSFDQYVRWIRSHEMQGLFFYADSPGSAGDRSYLNRLEALQRASGDRPGADLRAAQQALDAPKPVPASPGAVASALRSLKGLFGMTRYFGLPPAAGAAGSDKDGAVLLRFAQDYLPDLRSWYAQGLFDPGQRFDQFRAPFERERSWLMSPHWTRPKRKDRRSSPVPAELQAAVLQSPKPQNGGYLRGALVLARVIDASKARDWLRLASMPAQDGTPALIGDGTLVTLEGTRVACSVALTCSGLRALGVHEAHLACLPSEFLQGMEARAGLLGDLRGNHPQQWRRPRAENSAPESAPLDLSVVHLVIQLRTGEIEGEMLGPTADRSALLPRLQQWIRAKVPRDAIEILAIEAAWTRPTASGAPAPRNHYGYVDGISQPTLTPSATSQYWDDAVKAGELLLGWVNDRGDGPLEMPKGDPEPVTPAWLDDSTFLVVRKIRQHVARLDAIVERCAVVLMARGLAPSLIEARELVRAKLMGRGSDGKPLVEQGGATANDFDYRNDGDGAQCPFASHVRRANPRAPLAGGFPLPRIVRRGMSYGPPPEHPDPKQGDPLERGMLFMAYNASIAEQFEVIQRWLTGGNSSGVSSSQPDPFLGVPQLGEPTVYRFVHGDQVIRVDLGDQPISQLEWGLYAFVPSIELLGTLETLQKPPPETVSPPASKTVPVENPVKTEFEDDLTRANGWKRVRESKTSPGVEKRDQTVLVGGYDEVMTVLCNDGSRFSANGYGDRMQETLGRCPFGQDDAGAHDGHHRPHVRAVKEAIQKAVTAEASFTTAHAWVETTLKDALRRAQPASVDVVELGSGLVAELCRQWFGVVCDTGVAEVGGIDVSAKTVRCPGDFLVMARTVFSAYPNDVVKRLADSRSPGLKEAVKVWVNAARGNANPPPVMAEVLRVLDAARIGDDERNATVANLMVGLPATLLGTWVKLLMRWIADRRLWQLQHALARELPITLDHRLALQVLWPELIGTMAADPVADGIWRTVQQKDRLGGLDLATGDIVWLGLGAALSQKPGDLQAAEDLLFGGPPGQAPHACPGRDMAVGALLGALAALLMAGTWAPTASPAVLSLTR